MRPAPTHASPVETVLDYHAASRHRRDGYAPAPGFPDWDSQPDPFRRWAGAPVCELPLSDGTGRIAYDALYHPATNRAAPDEHSLGLLLELALGLSAWKRFGPDRWALRNNPSSGNLHPTEGYLLLWRHVSAAIPPGLYHYAPHEHALECRARLPAAQAEALARAHPATFGALAFTSILWREEWKYGARAYRYCQLDVGHALGAARYAAATLGWSLCVDPCPGDRTLAALLGLDRTADFSGAEPEHPELLALLGDGALSAPDWRALAGAWHDWRGQANRLSAERVRWPQIECVLPAVTRPDQALPRPWPAPLPPVPLPPPVRPCDAVTLIRSRRSAQRMDAQTGIAGAAFQRILTRMLPTRATAPFDALPHVPQIDLVLFVHDVAGLTPGLYALPRNGQRAQSLLRAMHTAAPYEYVATGHTGVPLVRLRAPRDLRRVASTLSCHQGIAGRGAFAVAMLADLGRVLENEGAWAWRRLHWEAGLVGQALYLEAQAAGLRGTGIGCFFDDEVLGLLGLETGTRASWQVLYHFTVGQAVEDRRLGSEPPYAHLAARRPAGTRS